jgi:anti-anti-sigma factor
MGIGLSINTEEHDKKHVIRLEGRIDAACTPILETKLEELLQAGHTFLLIDFTRVDYISSAGLRFLLSATKKAKAAKGMLTLSSVQDEVMEIIKMAGFERILHIFPNETAALAALESEMK